MRDSAKSAKRSALKEMFEPIEEEVFSAFVAELSVEVDRTTAATNERVGETEERAENEVEEHTEKAIPNWRYRVHVVEERIGRIRLLGLEMLFVEEEAVR